ncbi:MAG: hypothetical protein EBZ58_10485 [Bacteroidetes bacterium]|nr:hypothetical protein [Bacteroidota bacterium]
MEKLEKLNYSTIILGGTLEALIHSYVEGIPLIMVNPQLPFYRDADPTGLNKNLAWRRLSYYLSYAGLNPLADKASTCRFDEDNILTVFGKTAYKIQIKYNNIIRYDEIKPTEKLRVLDTIKVENIQAQDIEVINKINTGEEFITEFYTMIDNKISQLIAVSHLTQAQLKEENYSEVYARLKATEVLKNHGVVGRFEPLSNGSGRTHKIKTSILKREILLDTKLSEDKMLMERKETKDINLKKITEMLGNPYAL